MLLSWRGYHKGGGDAPVQMQLFRVGYACPGMSHARLWPIGHRRLSADHTRSDPAVGLPPDAARNVPDTTVAATHPDGTRKRRQWEAFGRCPRPLSCAATLGDYRRDIPAYGDNAPGASLGNIPRPQCWGYRRRGDGRRSHPGHTHRRAWRYPAVLGRRRP